MSTNYKFDLLNKTIPINPYPWLFFSTIMSLYVWLLPFFANITNMNNNKYLCSSNVICSDNTSFFNITGTHIGCGCGQGIFGQSICPVSTYGYTISSYIATAPATGAMACVSAFPIVAIWLFGTGSNNFYNSYIIPKFITILAKTTVSLFLICFFIFLFATDCIFPNLHDIVVTLFCTFGIMHYSIIAFIYKFYYYDKKGSAYITYLCIISVVSFCGFIFFGNAYYNYNIYHFQYLPWFFECLGVTISFSIAPLMLLYEYTH